MFKIMGQCRGGCVEIIDEFETREEADRMLSEYRMAFGPGWGALWVAEGSGS